MKDELTTIEAFWKVLKSPTGDEDKRRKVELRTPNFSFPKLEFNSPRIATS